MCCKLPQRGLRNRIWCILAVKYDIGGSNFNDFAENQLTKVRAVETALRFKDLGFLEGVSLGTM